MNSARETITISIDNQTLNAERGLTILQAAEQNNIYIPTLCAHKDLSPFGACRMCIVEVDGIRGFPTACTTPAENGMVVRTNTEQVDALRLEVLQLILSEHTSSCLICDEKVECRQVLNTIRKAGVTTGCRYCPRDGQCELQDVVERLGLNRINLPVHYRNLRIEKDDPFFDRDYNLCILCGRCVRVCQDIRGASTLAFKQRGRDTVIGPAFHRTHMDGACEFCGDCISVCPTGAMAEKSIKWDGKADREELTTCPLCGIGCQVRLLAKGDAVMGALPAEDPLVNGGQLCLKGRFCIPELVNNYQRLAKPIKKLNGTGAEIIWEEAIGMAAEKLSNCAPDEFGMVISPDCCNEDLYVAQKFARAVMGSHNIDTPARIFYGAGFNEYIGLMKKSVPLSDIHKASVILSLGLDARFARSVVTVELRKAIRQGAKLITINPQPHNLSLIASKWIQPSASAVLDLLRAIVQMTGKDRNPGQSADPEAAEVAGMLANAAAPVILVGSEFLSYDNSDAILAAVAQLAQNLGAGIVPLPAQGNLYGTLLMGAYPELLPGGFSSANRQKLDELRLKWNRPIPEFASSWNTAALLAGIKMKVLYFIGEVPSNWKSLSSEFTICQNIYPPKPSEADLALPAAAFTEVEGTLINGEGRIQKISSAAVPPGEALPDWQILCRIAQKMGISGFDYQNASEIRREIGSLVPQMDFAGLSRNPSPLVCEGVVALAPVKPAAAYKTNGAFLLLLSASAAEHTYRGFPLSAWAEGARTVFPEEIVEINPQDAARAGISQGDEIVVTSGDLERIWPVKIIGDQPEGMLHIVLRQGDTLNPNPHSVRIRKKDV